MSTGVRTVIGVLLSVVAAGGAIGSVHIRAQSRGEAPGAAHQQTADAASDELRAADVIRPVIGRYCVTCHNERSKTAGLLLDKVDLDHLAQDAAVWEKVVRKLRSGSMPPVGLPRPDPHTYDAVATALERELDRAAAATPDPGRSPIHRLNRAEYANAVRDLLGVELDVRSLLPADDAGYGFDNNADVLTLSPALLDRYLSAARAISRQALGDLSVRPTTKTYKLPEAPVLMQSDRMGEDLPFGSRGGLAVRHHFPIDGEYVLKVRLQRVRDGQGEIRGLYEPSELDVRVDGERLRLFTVGRDVRSQDGTAVEPELVSVSLNIKDHDLIEYETTADAPLELRFDAHAGTRTVSIAFVAKGYEPESIVLPKVTDFGYARNKGGHPDVATLEIGGPYRSVGLGDTESRRRILLCRPNRSTERSCARSILSALARKAYRRAVVPEDIDALLKAFDEGRRERTFESGIEAAITRLLVDPDFLFRIGREPNSLNAPGAYRIGDVELASRLSFFLWSSIPDEELLDLAIRGRLSEPTVLEQQVRRMLVDTRSRALMSNFAGQWLYLRNLRTHQPDRPTFPEFDENLREAFQRETELFFESIIREDRSVLDLLAADYTFVNERLARHYGIPDVHGSHFRRVTLSGERRPGGLLGQGSVLTVTSYATRTSPVLRGKWLLDNVLGAPPPPPPPNVPDLKESGEGGARLPVRAAMELHRKNPACASCHARMDPLGFALENFDAVGAWREKDAGEPIDASGALPDGSKFIGATELRQALLRHPDEFVLTLTEKLLTYAIGRGLEYYDAPAVRDITRAFSKQGYSWSSLVLAIVRSTPFQMRRSDS